MSEIQLPDTTGDMNRDEGTTTLMPRVSDPPVQPEPAVGTNGTAALYKEIIPGLGLLVPQQDVPAQTAATPPPLLSVEEVYRKVLSNTKSDTRKTYCGKKKRQHCSVEDCSSKVQKKGLCQKHLADEDKPSKPICSVEDCSSKVQKKGLCHKHLADEDKPSKQLCSVEDCSTPVVKKGLCHKHLADEDKAKLLAGRKRKQPEKSDWVQCDSCAKWRRLPANINSDQLQDEWHCNSNTWDKYLTCDTAEEED
ncbi:hypothetical protein ACHAXM_001212 [Skeletonema potamos]